MQNGDVSTAHPYQPGQTRKILSNLAAVSFFLLFPGFLLYHQSLAMGIIQPFAGGLFGYVSLGTVLAFLLLLPWSKDWVAQNARNGYVLFVLAFLLYTSVWAIAHYLFLSGDYITMASRQSAEIIVLWSCLFLVGLVLPLEFKSLRWAFLLSFVIILTFLVYFTLSTGANAYHAHRFYEATTDVATYQGFARSTLVILLFLIALFNSIRARTIFILGGVFALFMLTSRSDFYAFLALSGVLCIVLGIKNPKYFLLLLLVCLEVLILAWPDLSPRLQTFTKASTPEVVTEAQTEIKSGDSSAADNSVTPPAPVKPPRLRRQFQIIDLSESKSWTSRQYLQQVAIDQIAQNPFLGKFGGHVTGNHVGRYAHNALSAWVTYGLIGFFMYSGLTLAGFLVPAREIIWKRQDTPLWTFAFMVNFVCLLLIIASKSVYWPLPALGWGITAKALLEAKTVVRQ